MTASETDVHSARVEAATNAMVDSEAYYCALHMRPDELRKDARDVLAAADAVVTVEMIAEVVAEITAGQQNQRLGPDDSVWVPSDFNLDAREVAEAVHRLYRGEGQS